MNSESDNYEVKYCADEDEYRVHCEMCDKLCGERFFRIHLKSGTHTNNIRKNNKVNSFI